MVVLKLILDIKGVDEEEQKKSLNGSFLRNLVGGALVKKVWDTLT